MKKMTTVPMPSPENIIASSDPGDETANRYYFQWTWAAVVCCMLLDDKMGVQEVFCEHHEDVLLKYRDGTFTGHQVKTRNEDQPMWKASDEAVLTACIRFAKLEFEYPSKFRGFYFLTNHPLYSAGTKNDLRHVLQSIKDAESFENLPSTISPWIKKVARKAGVPESVAFDALSKTVADSKLPKLHDAVMRLINTITQCWAPAADCSYDVVRRAAQALIDECGRASSLGHEQLLPAYLIVDVNKNADIMARINGKRMTIVRVQEILEHGRDSLATLTADPALCVKPGEGSTELLHKKLDAGGFSVISRNSAEDLRNKADYLGIVWTKKFGNEKGLQRYDHIRSIVLSDAGRAFDATQTNTDDFGPKMREHLRHLFRERRKAGNELFDSTDDHLEGIVFSLTAQCMVVWSHAKPWESE